jgi:hypothetical protein
MKYLKKLPFILITLLFINCGKIRSDNESNSLSDTEKDTAIISTTQKKDLTSEIDSVDQSETKGSILSEPTFTKEPNEPITSETGNTRKSLEPTENKKSQTPNISGTLPIATKTETKKASAPSNFTIQKILNGCKTGETLTQEELSKNLEIPKDAIKLVKSITKIAQDEIDIKWNSTWAVEKISDAKFKDGRLKVRFENNKMYTSGDAIGIKYKRKIYTDLVVYGRAARIPSVKGYYWKIGRDD